MSAMVVSNSIIKVKISEDRMRLELLSVETKISLYSNFTEDYSLIYSLPGFVEDCSLMY